MPDDCAMYAIQVLSILKARCESHQRLIVLLRQEGNITFDTYFGATNTWDEAIELIDTEIARLEAEHV